MMKLKTIKSNPIPKVPEVEILSAGFIIPVEQPKGMGFLLYE
jgi:hypothetical protein